MSAGFLTTSTRNPHNARTRAILRAHPEVRSLVGRNPWTALLMVCIVSAQIAIASMVGRNFEDYWWIVLVTAYLFGAFAHHALYVIIHEATHDLVFRSRLMNKCVAIIADLPNLFPGAMGFGLFHLAHHAHQGKYDHDADLASEWEARLVGNRWYMKALWLLFFPFFQLTRPVRLKAYTVVTRWTVANAIAAVAFDLAVIYFLGFGALVYLLLSMMFSVGLHPLGARWIQEHYTNEVAQETFSYYGPANVLALNVGYHNEHHDFPSIPWNRLPKLRKMCPEFYDKLKSYRSWSGLLLQFLFDVDYTLHSRVSRR